MKNEKCFTGNLSLLDVDMLYLLMVNRIARRYSAEELAFLLGESTDFILEFERLQRVGFGTRTFYKLRQIFDHYVYTFGYHTVNSQQTNEYRMDISQVPDKTIYTLECITNTHESVLVFQLQEGVHKYLFDDRPNVRERKSISLALQAGLNIAMFDEPRCPYEIFSLVEEVVERSIDPINLQHELHRLVGKKGQAPLKRFKCRTLGYRYIKHKTA